MRERRPPPPQWSSGISNVRFDEHVARDAGGCDPVAAVPDVERLAGTRQAHRRRLATLLEPHAVALDLRAVETTVSEADVRERDPGRCERRICDTPPFSRSSRVRTGGVEPPQPLATRLQRAELAGARRPQGETRAAGRIRTDTAGLTTPDAGRYITAAKRNGRRDRLPATGGRDVTVWFGPGASCCTFRQSCLRRCDAATSSPVGPGGLSAQLHVRARALHSPVPSLPDSPVGEPFLF